MKKIGYIQGTFDMFHVGHLNLIRNAKKICDELIIAVNSDELVRKYKNKTPVIGLNDRVEIIRAIKYVDKVVIANDRDKKMAYEKYKFDYLIMGDDWKNTEFYNKVEIELKNLGVSIIYFPYTKNISTTKIVKIIEDRLKMEEL